MTTTTEKRESKPTSRKEAPKENPHHCPECHVVGKYKGRQQQSLNHTLIAWCCENGHHWNYTYSKNELPDPTILVS